MPELNLKYELKLNKFIKIQKLEFENYRVDLQKDQSSEDPDLFKNGTPYKVYPDDNFINIYLLANASGGGEGFKWSLNVWINDKLITQKSIEVKINSAGRADYNDKVKWN